MLIKHWLGSLVNRATAMVVVVILVVALTVMLVSGLLSQRELEQQAKAHVESVAAVVAYELDDKLSMRLNIISQVATNLTMTEQVFRDRAELFLSRQTELLHLLIACLFSMLRVSCRLNPRTLACQRGWTSAPASILTVYPR